MIRIYVKASYDRQSRSGFFYYFSFSNTTGMRNKESGNYECRNVFQAECKSVYRALSWWSDQRAIREDFEVACSPVVAMYLNSVTSKYFKLRSEDDMRAVGRVSQITAIMGVKVAYTPRRVGDETYVDLEHEIPEAGACH